MEAEPGAGPPNSAVRAQRPAVAPIRRAIVALLAMLLALSAAPHAASASAQPLAAQFGLTSFCTPSQDFPENRRFRVTNSSGVTTQVVLRNQTNGATVLHIAPPGQSFVLVPASLDPGSPNTTQLIVDGVTVAVKAANNRACTTVEGDAVCVPGTGAFTVTWAVRNNSTGPSTITGSSIPALVFTPNPVPANGVATATETVPAPPTGSVIRTLELTVDLGQQVIGNPGASVILGRCEGPVPSFTFTKTADRDIASAGEEITYTYSGTNTGQVPLEVTQLVDDRLGILIEEPEITVVAPGESLTRTVPYTVTPQDAAIGRIDNAAVVTVVPVGASTPLTAVATAEVTVPPLPPPPDTLEGNAVCDPATGTYAVEWLLVHRGPGDAVVQNPSRPVVFEPAVIPEGTTAVATETVPAPATGTTVLTLDLVVAAAPGSPLPRALGPVSATVTLGRCVGEVSFTFTKSADRERAAVGDVITYTYSGTNTGAVPIEVDQLVDDRLGVLLDGPGTTPLLPGETLTRTVQYTVTALDASVGDIDNVAVVTGSRVDNPEAATLSAVDEAIVLVDPIPEGPDPAQPGLAASGTSASPFIAVATLAALAGAGLLAIGRRRFRR